MQIRELSLNPTDSPQHPSQPPPAHPSLHSPQRQPQHSTQHLPKNKPRHPSVHKYGRIFRDVENSARPKIYFRSWPNKYSRTSPCGHPTTVDTPPLWTLFPI